MTKRTLMQAAILGLAFTATGLLMAEPAKPATEKAKTHMRSKKEHSKKKAESRAANTSAPAAAAASTTQTPK